MSHSQWAHLIFVPSTTEQWAVHRIEVLSRPHYRVTCELWRTKKGGDQNCHLIPYTTQPIVGLIHFSIMAFHFSRVSPRCIWVDLSTRSFLQLARWDSTVFNARKLLHGAIGQPGTCRRWNGCMHRHRKEGSWPKSLGLLAKVQIFSHLTKQITNVSRVQVWARFCFFFIWIFYQGAYFMSFILKYIYMCRGNVFKNLSINQNGTTWTCKAA